MDLVIFSKIKGPKLSFGNLETEQTHLFFHLSHENKPCVVRVLYGMKLPGYVGLIIINQRKDPH